MLMLDPVKVQNTIIRHIHRRARALKMRRLKGDASNRIYFRLRYSLNGRPQSIILMELAAPEAFKQSEEATTRTIMSVKGLPYINILNHLARANVAVPKLYFYDRRARLLFLEDLGDRTLEKQIEGKSKNVIHRAYEKALDEMILIQTQGLHLRNKNCIAFGREFDVPLLMWEFDHFLEYGIPYCAGRKLLSTDRRKIRRQFLKIAEELVGLPQTLTHRDYHSRNLMVHQKKIWVLDFQDALLGPHVYDLASLLRDSYRTLGESQVQSLLVYYWEHLQPFHGPRINQQGLRRLFDLMSIQRNLKAAGRFVYIQKVKKNPRFLPYIPRTLGYVRKNLNRYPELSPLKKLLLPYMNGSA